ncbi:MAG: sigma-54-dependent Fis family transcriptional regulator [Acidobacteriales bacterium]|nr:sigma-54-dependent Fis family transcriptional regulator [Terriglobales bacterium]
MSLPSTVLVIDDEPGMLRYMRTLLELDSYHVETAASGPEALRILEAGLQPDLIFLDLLMPEMDGLETLDQLRQSRPNLKIVMLSCVSDTAMVVQSMRQGAQDYLTKPFEKHSLDAILTRYLAPRQGAYKDVPCEVEELDEGLFFLAGCDAMKKIRAEVGLIATVDIPVLILGESGTGKEIVARLIHKHSARSHKPFMKVNIAALPEDLLESELFGYEAGAFTGANKSKPGKFEVCNRGTLLLDEIGELPVQLQAKLLHVLQDGEFSRLGSRASMKADVRVLAATNIDVQKAIAEKTLREDLYYRLAAFTITVPPLRERREEVPMLLQHMMNRMAENYGRPPMDFSPELIKACVDAPWQGNVRELNNFVKRFLIMGDESQALEELRNGPAGSESALSSPADSTPPSKVSESEVIQKTLASHNWDRKRAAAALNLTVKELAIKIRRYQIRVSRPLSFVDKDAK